MGDERAEERPALDPAGFTVTKCCVDYAFNLVVARPERAERGQEWANLRIEGPFEFFAAGTAAHFNTEETNEHPEALGPLLTLFRRIVEGAEVGDDGTLRLTFSGQMALRVLPSPLYESWDVSHGDGRRFICMPGGEIAIWSAREG